MVTVVVFASGQTTGQLCLSVCRSQSLSNSKLGDQAGLWHSSRASVRKWCLQNSARQTLRQFYQKQLRQFYGKQLYDMSFVVIACAFLFDTKRIIRLITPTHNDSKAPAVNVIIKFDKKGWLSLNPKKS